jgi:hypothetical protein
MAKNPKDRGKPGRVPQDIGDGDRSEFLRLIRSGFGIHMALAEMKIGWNRYDRTLKNDREFRREVDHAVAYRRENLVALRYAQALGGDPRALDMLIARDDEAERFAIRMRAERKAATLAAEAVAKHPPGAITVKVEYEEPDGRLHRPDGPPPAPAAPGPAEDPP